MSIILSLNKSGLFGINNKLAYVSKKDMNVFSTISKSIGNVVMGKNTWNSLPNKPLSNRLNIIISKSLNNEIISNNKNSHVVYVRTIEDVFKIVAEPCFIGGYEIFSALFKNNYFNKISKIYLTEFEDNVIPQNGLILKLPTENFKMQSTYSNTDTVNTYNGECSMKMFHITFSRIYSQDISHKLDKKISNYESYESYKSYELNYLNEMAKILKNPIKQCRNGLCHSVFGLQFKYDCSDGFVPLITTKKMAWKTCIKELLWFISGSTDNKKLKEQNVHIWNSNSTEEFLKARGLNYEEDDLGAIYGHQWRFYNAKYINCNTDYTNKGIDQLKKCEEMLKTDPFSRRIIMTTWNPNQIDEMALPPCHILIQWYVSTNEKLYLHFYQRSADMFLGIPFNMFSYSILLHMMSLRVGIAPGGVVHSIGDAHIYSQHVNAVYKQLKNEIKSQPKIKINVKKNWEDYSIDDFNLINYECADKIVAELVA